MSVLVQQRRPRPTGSEFIHEVAAVAADIPRFATAPLYRGWHRRWGATDPEVVGSMPGDDLVPRAQYQCTRAISIGATLEAVWPWLIQVGCLRAGFYADDLLDNLSHPSARTILSEFQTLEIGQWVPMSPNPTEVTAFKVAAFEPDQWLLWEQPVSTWAWRLTPTKGGSRLITRIRDLLRLDTSCNGAVLVAPQRVWRLPHDAADAPRHQGTSGRPRTLLKVCVQAETAAFPIRMSTAPVSRRSSNTDERNRAACGRPDCGLTPSGRCCVCTP